MKEMTVAGLTLRMRVIQKSFNVDESGRVAELQGKSLCICIGSDLNSSGTSVSTCTPF